MATDNTEALQRLQKAREPREKKERKPIARVSEKQREKLANQKPEPRKPIAKRSEKMKGIMAAIKPLYKAFLRDRPICEINSPACVSQSSCVHHTAGRGMNHLMDMESWKAACDPCNDWVEAHDAEARGKGNKVSRLNK